VKRIKGAVDGYWRWQKSRQGALAGRPVGFPRFKKKARDADRFTVTTGVMRVNADRRSLSLPKVGAVRTHENTRRLERLVRLSRARILAVTVRRRGTRIHAIFRVAVSRKPKTPARPGSVVGVDDNAAVNLARYPASEWQPRAVGPVGSPDKRRASCKTGPRPAGGVEAPKPDPERGAA
jgi:transposase